MRMPVTTDIPMLYDETIYKVYIIMKSDTCNLSAIKVVSKVCNINYLSAKNELKKKRNLIIEGKAYMIVDILKKLLQYEVDFEIEPSYPYEIK